MGTFHEPIELWNPDKPRRKICLEAVVDTGAAYSVIPSRLLRRLDIKPIRTMPFKLADGRIIRRRIGEATIRVKRREIRTLAVFGDNDAEPLLGAYALGGLALGVDSLHRSLVPIPAYLVGFAPPSWKPKRSKPRRA